jgi:hypothetical protein
VVEKAFFSFGENSSQFCLNSFTSLRSFPCCSIVDFPKLAVEMRKSTMEVDAIKKSFFSHRFKLESRSAKTCSGLNVDFGVECQLFVPRGSNGLSMSGKGCGSTSGTTNPEAVENHANKDDVDDTLLEDFFAEIEGLTIHDDSVKVGDNSSNADFKNNEQRLVINNSQQSRRERLSPQKEKGQQQQSMIDRAEITKDNWKKFTIPNASSSVAASTIGRKPISFSLGASANAKTKKKARSKITRRQRHESDSTAKLPLGFGEEASPSHSSKQQGRDTSTSVPSLNHFLLPRWIAVLDTCAILESYESVCDMIRLARAATVGGSNSRHLPSVVSHGATVLEGLTVVVPYTVWDELDYRSKELEDEREKYKARRAARMLTDELVNEEQHREHRRAFDKEEFGLSGDLSSIRSQSRIESHRSVEAFVAAAASSGIPSNDDKILACALGEQNRFAIERSGTIDEMNATSKSSIGGVVLITLDKVLTGKARADGLSVHSPSEFVRYYNKRMASLRSRQNATGRGITAV